MEAGGGVHQLVVGAALVRRCATMLIKHAPLPATHQTAAPGSATGPQARAAAWRCHSAGPLRGPARRRRAAAAAAVT